MQKFRWAQRPSPRTPASCIIFSFYQLFHVMRQFLKNPLIFFAEIFFYFMRALEVWRIFFFAATKQHKIWSLHCSRNSNTIILNKKTHFVLLRNELVFISSVIWQLWKSLSSHSAVIPKSSKPLISKFPFIIFQLIQREAFCRGFVSIYNVNEEFQLGFSSQTGSVRAGRTRVMARVRADKTRLRAGRTREGLAGHV